MLKPTTAAECFLDVMAGKANVELEWFEKYANGRGYTWEKAAPDSDKDGNSSSR
jgi:hypothetical protein